MRFFSFLLRLTLSVLLIVIIDTQLRYLLDSLNIFSFTQGGLTKVEDNHIGNTYAQAVWMFFLMGWVYAIVILFYGALSRFINGKLLWLRFLIIVLSYQIAYSVYWYLSSFEEFNELYYGLTLYFVLGLISPIVLNYIMRGTYKGLRFSLSEGDR